MFARGRISSIRWSRRMLAAMEMTRHAPAMADVRRDVMLRSPGLKGSESFQIPALKNQDGAAQSHCCVKQGVQGVLQNQLSAYRLPMRHRADDVERGKVRNEVRSSGRKPAGDSVGDTSESTKVVGEAADDEQRERKHCRQKRSGK